MESSNHNSNNEKQPQQEPDKENEDEKVENLVKEVQSISIKEKIKSNKDDISEANRLKLLGNSSYSSSEYNKAVKYYSDAIELILSTSEISNKNNDNNDDETDTKEQKDKIVEIKENDILCSEELSIYYSNRAACYLSLKEYQLVIDDCNKSIELEPINSLKIKILHRRAQAFESLDKLTESFEDYKSILLLDPKFPQALQAQSRLPPKIKVKQDKERDEMLGKLKDLGNSILGKFGMSTDNFQFVKDPNSGGYSVNFKK